MAFRTDASAPYTQLARLRFPNGEELPIIVGGSGILSQPEDTFLPISIIKGIPMRADDANNTIIELVLDVAESTVSIETAATGRFKRS
jgi:hypothetical protein